MTFFVVDNWVKRYLFGDAACARDVRRRPAPGRAVVFIWTCSSAFGGVGSAAELQGGRCCGETLVSDAMMLFDPKKRTKFSAPCQDANCQDASCMTPNAPSNAHAASKPGSYSLLSAEGAPDASSGVVRPPSLSIGDSESEQTGVRMVGLNGRQSEPADSSDTADDDDGSTADDDEIDTALRRWRRASARGASTERRLWIVALLNFL